MDDFTPYRSRTSHDFIKLLGADLKELKGMAERINLIIENIENASVDFTNEQMITRRKDDGISSNN